MRAKLLRLILHLTPWILLVTGCAQKRDTCTTKDEPVSYQYPSTGSLLPGAWDPKVRNNLLRLIEIHGKHGSKHDPSNPPVIIFDFDNTCIRGDIGRSFYDWMVRKGKIRFSKQVFQVFPIDKVEAVRKTLKQLSMISSADRAESAAMRVFRKIMHQVYWSLCSDPHFDKCFPWQVRFYAGWRPNEIASMAEKVMKMELRRPLGSEKLGLTDADLDSDVISNGIRIFEEIHTLIALLKQSGFKVWIVSAGPQWVVEGAAKQIDIAPDFVIGMRAKVENGLLTTQIDPPPTYRKGKVLAIQKYIGTRPLLAVGDSWTDAEMLAYARYALLIDRGVADLKRKAEEAAWWIQPSFPVE